MLVRKESAELVDPLSFYRYNKEPPGLIICTLYQQDLPFFTTYILSSINTLPKRRLDNHF